MAEFEAGYEAAHEGVDIVINADSSGALLTQIEEGAPCDIFFSAAQKQMNTLEEAGMLVEGTRTNVLNNQLVVITQPDSETAVTGLADIASAKSIALADGSVPVGRYTRASLLALGILPEEEGKAEQRGNCAEGAPCPAGRGCGYQCGDHDHGAFHGGNRGGAGGQRPDYRADV